MAITHECAGCGSSIESDAPEGLCALCLLQSALANPLEDWPADLELTPILLQPAASLIVKFHSFGDYELLEEVARGGMGVVFRARQLSLNRIVALKFVLPGRLDSQESVRRFRQEAEAAACLEHPNIVPIYEIGEHQGHPYMAMPLLTGGTLSDRIARISLRDAPLNRAAYWHHQILAARLLARIARAVHYAHQHGIIHRDLKPSNIVLDSQEEPHLTDFGLAKVLSADRKLTQSLEVMGSPHYMAPEQAAGAPLTTAADLYSLGAILYELLTGRPPFSGETPLAILKQAQENSPHALRKLNPEVDRDLETICLKCLEKEPEHRYSSAAGLAADLEKWLRHEPIMARRASPRERLIKWTRRNPHLAIMAMALTTVVVLGWAGILWQWNEASHQAVRAKMNENTTRRQLIQSHVATGDRLAEEGDLLAALPWHVKALELETDPAAVARHRLRIGAILDLCPRLVHLWTHQGPVNATRFSPDGRLVASASADQTVRLWNTETGEAEFPAFIHSNSVLEVAFSADGQRLLTRTENNMSAARGRLDEGSDVLVWDVFKKRLIAAISHTSPVNAACFSTDGREVLTAGEDGQARLCDAGTGAIRQILPHPSPLIAAILSPEGGQALTSARDGRVRLWDLQTGHLLKEVPGSGETRQLAFSPNGSHCAALSSHGGWIMNLEHPNEEMRAFYEGASSAGAALEFSPDGQRLLLGYENLRVRICDVATASKLVTLNAETKVSFVRHYFGACFSPDGSSVLTWGEDGAARIWGALKGWRIYPPLRHAGAVTTAQFAPDGRRLVTGGLDGLVKVWDLVTTAALAPKKFHYPSGSQATWSPDGGHVASLSRDGQISLWNARDGEAIQAPELTIQPGQPGISNFRWSPDSQRLLTTRIDGAFRIWEGRSLSPLSGWIRLPSIHRPLTDISPAGNVVVVAGGKSTPLRFLEAETGNEIQSVTIPEAEDLMVLRYSPKGRWLLVAGHSTVHILDATNGEPVSPLLHLSSPINGLDIAPDDSLLVTASVDGKARLWTVPLLRAKALIFSHQDEILSAAFSPDGKSLLTASEDGTACVWEVGTGHKKLTLDHGNAVTAARFSPSGDRIGTACQLGGRVWDAVLGEPLTPWLKQYQFRSGAWNILPNPIDHKWLTFSGGFAAMVWPLRPDLRPLEELRAHAHLLAGGLEGAIDAAPLWQRLRESGSKLFQVTPQEALRWHRTMAEYAEVNEKPDTLAFHLARWLAAYPEDRWARHRAVTSLLAQGRQAEARKIDPAALPQRPPEAAPEQINLEAFYNWRLDTMGAPNRSPFRNLSPGLHDFGRIRFDVRGVVELGGLARLFSIGPLPTRAAGIPIRALAKELHVLQAASLETTQGTLIGRYVLHYQDGERRELPIRYGHDLRNYVGLSRGTEQAPGVQGTTVAWEEPAHLGGNQETAIRLYQRAYTNPRPEVEITSLDFESTMSQCSPMLFAITLER